MKVRIDGERLTAIGKNLRRYDAVDTGLFICPLEIFEYLDRAKSPSENDCSLADGVRLMASDKKVRAIDIGESWWQDVDTRQMLQHAEERIAAGLKVRSFGMAC
jgi:choline kinase